LHRGKVFLVGLGPGPLNEITPRAVDRLSKVAVVIGHRNYLELIKKYITAKQVISEEMTPVERSELAVKTALKGKDVALVSIGDPGIFAIASTFFNYIAKKKISVNVEVVPGITMTNSVAAVLGSPIGQDFAVISLSDQARPWNTIKKRLESVAQSDFVIVIYNPIGKVGIRRLKETIAILMEYRKDVTPVGVVSETDGKENTVEILTLNRLLQHKINENSTLVIGNSESYTFHEWMITPRNYKKGVGY
jgi:precorrin-3B C17-methyltransferase